MRRTTPPTWVRGLALWGALVVSAPAASEAQMRGLLTTTRVSDAAFDLELFESAPAADGRSAWLLVGARPKGRRGAEPSLRLLHVDATGTQASIDLPSVKRPAGSDPLAQPGRTRVFAGLAIAADGRPVVGMARSHLPVSLLPIASSGGSVGTAVPVRLQTDADLLDLISLANGRLLMLGAAGLRPFVAEVRPDGSVVWERVIAGDAPVTLDDAWPTADGGAVLLGRSGKDAASSVLWIARLSATGDVTAQGTTPGFDGDVTALEDGGVLVAADHVAPTLFDTTLVRLGADLATRQTSPLMQRQPTSGLVRLATLAGGDVMLAGVRDRGLWITRLTPAGETVWSDLRTPSPPDLELVAAVDVHRRGSTLVVPYGAYVVDGREQRQVVTLLRLSVE